MINIYKFGTNSGEVIKVDAQSEALAHLKLLDILMERGIIQYKGLMNSNEFNNCDKSVCKPTWDCPITCSKNRLVAR